MRRAFFDPGAGLLLATGTSLCFIADPRHAATSQLLQAVDAERPLRSVAAAVAAAGFDVSPFVLCVADPGARLQGMVFGEMAAVVGANGATVSGTSADPWATFEGQADDTVSVAVDDVATSSQTWIAVGQVLAGGFVWSPSPDRPVMMQPSPVVTPQILPLQPDLAPASASEPEPEQQLEPAPAPEPEPKPEPASAPERDSEAEPAPEPAHIEPGPLMTEENSDTEIPGPGALDPELEEIGDITDSPTIGAPPEQGDSEPNDTQVESLRCTSCLVDNAPTVARCAGCNSLLGDHNSEQVWIDQPVLGSLHFSNETIEVLDTTLIIGRNPALGDHQAHARTVVLGRDDLTVSRNHLVVYPDGWKAMVTNLKEGHGTMLQRLGGTAVHLAVDAPVQLGPGDSVLFGGLWMRYETSL